MNVVFKRFVACEGEEREGFHCLLRMLLVDSRIMQCSTQAERALLVARDVDQGGSLLEARALEVEGRHNKDGSSSSFA